ncbi:MAG: hypothetical protein REI11_20910 [Patulibacter sp.]|nr:hypothetical protein [Patulibacter sp.]
MPEEPEALRDPAAAGERAQQAPDARVEPVDQDTAQDPDAHVDPLTRDPQQDPEAVDSLTRDAQQDPEAVADDVFLDPIVEDLDEVEEERGAGADARAARSTPTSPGPTDGAEPTAHAAPAATRADAAPPARVVSKLDSVLTCVALVVWAGFGIFIVDRLVQGQVPKMDGVGQHAFVAGAFIGCSALNVLFVFALLGRREPPPALRLAVVGLLLGAAAVDIAVLYGTWHGAQPVSV